MVKTCKHRCFVQLTEHMMILIDIKLVQITNDKLWTSIPPIIDLLPINDYMEDCVPYYTCWFFMM